MAKNTGLVGNARKPAEGPIGYDDLAGLRDALDKTIDYYKDDDPDDMPTHPVHAVKALREKLTQLLGSYRQTGVTGVGAMDARHTESTIGAGHLSKGEYPVRKAADECLDEEAEKLMGRDPKLSKAQALDRVYKTSLGKRLVAAYASASTRQPAEWIEKTAPQSIESVAKREAWSAIEREADALITKSQTRVSKAKAIDQVMKQRPDLVTKYYAAV